MVDTLKIVLDECLPRLLKHELPGFDVSTVSLKGWSGQKNGRLLQSMLEAEINVFVTIDQNLEYQQNLERLVQGKLAILVLDCPSNSLPALRPLIPALRDALAAPRLGQITHIGKSKGA